MIELRHLNKTFLTKSGWVSALDDFSLTVNAGEIVGVIGRSGAGKSTLLRCINMLAPPDTGEVKIDDCDLMALRAPALRLERQRIGMIFQHFNLLSTRTVFDNVALPLKLHGVMQRSELEERVLPLLDIVGLRGRQDCYPHQLSGGQKQRVAIARAMVSQPRVLLCDEATSALDAHTRDDILKLMREINQKFNISIVLITHQLDVVKQVADRVVVLDQGRLMEDQPLIEFMMDPLSDMGRKLVMEDLRLTLPEGLNARLKSECFPGSSVFIKLTFSGEVATKPVVAAFARDHHLELNILQASLESVQNQLVGAMLISIDMGHVDETTIVTGLRERGIKVEVLGYDQND